MMDVYAYGIIDIETAMVLPAWQTGANSDALIIYCRYCCK
jgi:hypothetical protein